MFGGGFPFEEFERMHGAGGGRPGAGRAKKNVDTNKYYDLLGVEKKATFD
jgi:hypothetical protein